MEVWYPAVTPSTDSCLRWEFLEVEQATDEVARTFVDPCDIASIMVLLVIATITRKAEGTVDLSKGLKGLLW